LLEPILGVAPGRLLRRPVERLSMLNFRWRGNACLQWQLCAVAWSQVREPATRTKINASWESGTLKLV
jgi:hypothetical protein